MKNISVLEHRGKKILYANHQNNSAPHIIDIIRESEELIIKMSNPDLRLLVDIRNCEVTPEVVEQFKITAKKIKQYRKKTAVLGVTKMQRVYLVAVNKFSGIEARAFDDEITAKEWLVT
ncbi:MAG: STAS/SEC14 domain-containing protein [Rhodothermaceae bacterium]